MRFLGRSPRRDAVPYVLHPPYGEARSKLLSRRPAPEDDAAAGYAGKARPFGRLFAVVADVGLDDYLVSVYLFADGTISIYSSVGIHSTGLRGAPRVDAAATAILEEVEAVLGEFSPVEDIGTLPLPDRGTSQILARTYEGDFAASDRLEFETRDGRASSLRWRASSPSSRGWRSSRGSTVSRPARCATSSRPNTAASDRRSWTGSRRLGRSPRLLGL